MFFQRFINSQYLELNVNLQRMVIKSTRIEHRSNAILYTIFVINLTLFSFSIKIERLQLKGSEMCLRHTCNGGLLDVRSRPNGGNSSSANRLHAVVRHHGLQRRLPTLSKSESSLPSL